MWKRRDDEHGNKAESRRDWGLPERSQLGDYEDLATKLAYK